MPSLALACRLSAAMLFARRFYPVFLQDDDGQTITADGDPIILFVE